MRRALLLSIRLHGLWFLQAFGRNGRSIAPLRPGRIAVLLLLYPPYLAVMAVHWIGFLLDEILFRGYRNVPIEKPVVITGIPRSGTTFLHRTLAEDTNQFTTMRTWEALFAPSITQRCVLKGIARLDRAVGRPLHRLLDALTRRFTRGFAHIHEVGLRAPEEDYLTLLPAAGCFIMVLAFPASPSLWQLGRFHEIPAEQRAILIDFYKACLRKHLYAEGRGRRLLSKNAAFASWLPDLRFALPDARFIVCVREPRPALASQLSSLRSGLRVFGTLTAAETYSLQFQTAFAHAYRIIQQETGSFLVDHLSIIDQKALRADSRGILEQMLKQLGIPVTSSLQNTLDRVGAETHNKPSSHQHEPLSNKSGPAEFGSLVMKIYEDILNHPHA